MSLPALPCASFADTVMTFTPACSGMSATDQFVVPVAVPLPPRSFTHVTDVTATSSAAVPASEMNGVVDAIAGAVVGELIVTRRDARPACSDSPRSRS